jgi:succinoglycan biosynthesis protein ExoA
MFLDSRSQTQIRPTERNILQPQSLRVSCVLLCRNEAKYIAGCLDAVLSFELPPDTSMECLVVDGCSTDGSREIVARYVTRDQRVRLIDNPARITPCAMNAGIRAAKGDFIMILGAHTHYPSDYLRRCVEIAVETGADNVGGIRLTHAEKTLWHQAIAVMINHPFAAGNAHYRVGVATRRQVDTVFGGCYRREVFARIGLFNESLVRAQDREFNVRLAAGGGRIILDPSIHCTYFPRINLWQHLRWSYLGGLWVFLAQKISQTRLLSWRNYIPGIFVVAQIAVVCAAIMGESGGYIVWSPVLLYAVCAMGAAFHAAVRDKRLALMAALPFLFYLTHLAYGVGSLHGIIRSWFTSARPAPR